MSVNDPLLPTRPYLARAIYQWALDNSLTPYLLVDAEKPQVQVPRQYVQDGQIVLNINPAAVHQFEITSDFVRFQARFGGVSQLVYVPIQAVLGIYARENGQGLFFDPEEYPQDAASATTADDTPQQSRPQLRILD